MNKLIDKILLEWSYRVHDGMPNPKNPLHLIHLEDALNELSLPREVTKRVLKKIRERDLVKNKLSGNVYDVEKVNKDRHILIKKDASEKDIETVKQSSDIKTTLSMITSCIDMIYNDEESWSGSESTKKELEEFIEQLNSKQFKLIEDFFTTMPKLTHTVKVKNPQTEIESDVVLEGLAAFFS